MMIVRLVHWSYKLKV